MTRKPDDAYPSRVGGEAYISERLDPVVYGEPMGALSRYRRDAYEANGFMILESFLASDELAELRQEAERIRAEAAQHPRPEVIVEPDSRTVRSVFDIHRSSGVIDKVVRMPRLLKMVQELLGSDVYVTQSRINYKPSFDGREFHWHSDFETWHVEDGMPRIRSLSCSFNLTPNTEFNGPLMVIPGSHMWYVSCAGTTPENNYERSLRKQETGVPDRDSMQRLFEMGGIVTSKGPAGSLTVFDSNIMHGSNSNITPVPRTNIFIVFNSVENCLVEPYCGLPPRPEHIANRTDIEAVKPLAA